MKKNKKDETKKTTVSVSVDGGDFKEVKPFSKELKDEITGFNRKIIGATVTKNKTLEVLFSEVRPDGTTFSYGVEVDGLVHKDLLDSFRALVPHLIIISDLREVIKDTTPIENYDEGLFTHINVNSFLISGNGDREGVKLSGTKEVFGGTIKVPTPQTVFGGLYKFSSELAETIETCKYEVGLYLEGKYAVKQTEMEFEEESEVDVPEELTNPNEAKAS